MKATSFLGILVSLLVLVYARDKQIRYIGPEHALRVLPNRDCIIDISLANIGLTEWRSPYMVVKNVNSNLQVSPRFFHQIVAPREIVTFQIHVPSTTQIGLHKYEFAVYDHNNEFIGLLEKNIEVTCDDGVFCNGIERFVDGECRNSADSCNDGLSCSRDICNEQNGSCSYILGNDCPSCAGEVCVPDCDGLECGSDGCDSFCGTCKEGFGCSQGTCQAATADGTCNSPIALLPNNFSFNEKIIVFGDTTDGINEVVPSCNALSDALEKIFVFTIPSGRTIGIEARVYDSGERGEDEYDTVLEIRQTCSEADSVVDCSDDSTPPGFFGSRVNALLTEGRYYIIVDGYSLESFGSFALELNFVDGCMPLCDGALCGDDQCGGSCGSCSPDDACNALGRCDPIVCVPDCSGKECGSDGCGGACGECSGEMLCLSEDFVCEEFLPCNHFLPECVACSSTEYCGSDCECHDIDEPRPDLILNVAELQNVFIERKTFTETSCAIAEECVGGFGERKLLKMTIESINQGLADLLVPEPKTRPDLFSYSECHGHYHFEGYAIIDLLNLDDDDVVVKGSKVGFCMEDTIQSLQGPKFSCSAEYDCGKQGIQAGWADVYGPSLDCNWIDVTGVPAGDYRLRVILNRDRLIDEATFDNNQAIVLVNIPREDDQISYSVPSQNSVTSTSDTSFSFSSSSSSSQETSSDTSSDAACLSKISIFVIISLFLLQF